MSDNYNQIFSINNTINTTNEDVIITITPPENISRYEYKIIENDVVVSENVIPQNISENIVLYNTGNYRIDVILYDELLNQINVSSGIYKIDKDAPKITLNKNIVQIKLGENISIYDGITAYDQIDGDLTNKLTTNYDKLDMSTVGLKQLVYSVSDSAGNTSTSILNIDVVPNHTKQILFFEGIIIAFIFAFIVIILRYLKSVKLEKRIAKYAIEPLKDNSPSIFDKFFSKYHQLVSKVGTMMEKSVFLVKYSKRFEKYIGTINKNYTKAIDFVASKVFVGILFLIIAIFSKTIQSEILTLYEIIIPITVGFFIPDLLYFSKYKIYRSKLENDLLQAIIIMNNAFKSGRSITQAIDLVAGELDGPMAEEFKKMSLEISFGLSIEDVFKRLSKRIELEEVSYLTASLSILNKTGGNIIKVFSSIEKTLFNKKKLKLELLSLTGSSKIIVYVLFIVPILFIAFISLIDPTYFLPLITKPLGLVITFVILVVYVIYIIVIRKVMKVRM